MLNNDDYVFKVRGNYTLACWGEVFKYSVDDWKTVIDGMAEDQKNTIYFWLSGLFRSEKYPESFFYPQTRLKDADVRELIYYCHGKGIKFYLGYGVFAWFGMDKVAEAHPDTLAKENGGMCPSNELARKINLEYGMEMLDRYPGVDGFFLEMRDEYGPCLCDTCQKPLDEHGSKQYGQSELTWLKEFTTELWKRKPEAEISVTVGYREKGSHTNDPMYYEGIRAMDEPRTYWMAVRDNYELPGAGGKQYPLSHFSKQMLHWIQYYSCSPKQIGEWAARAHKAGAIGACPAFEPGFNSYSYYSYDVPFPVNVLPYRMTRFAFQQFCGNPELSYDRFKELAASEFFDPGVDPRYVEDLLYLSEVIQAACGSRKTRLSRAWKSGWFRECAAVAAKATDGKSLSEDEWHVVEAAVTEFRKMDHDHSARLAEIETRLMLLESKGGRSRATAEIMRKAIIDTRWELMFGPEHEELLARALKNAKCNLPETKG
ncbi:MAG: hypothetical protein Q7T82_21075 [Armatimonadota bacterium]|nr:hypothetical protein [Armatimonadota bacterium]